ncbi:hypothetical protein MKEN_01259300 [Mycena kentingensis (nom. inval.)]|nr:hypothetical protein MKEN_01259300 [Mycena kentingensis (nom. inval.)]
MSPDDDSNSAPLPPPSVCLQVMPAAVNGAANKTHALYIPLFPRALDCSYVSLEGAGCRRRHERDVALYGATAQLRSVAHMAESWCLPVL